MNESDRMTHIVQDLLTLSRFDSGRDDLKLSCFPSGELCRICTMRFIWRRSATAINWCCLSSLTCPRYGRTGNGLYSNDEHCLKFHQVYPDGGEIHISAGRSGDRVWMQVDDNGIGIPAEDRPRSSSAFIGWIRRAPASRGAPAWGCPLPRKLWTGTRAPWSW